MSARAPGRAAIYLRVSTEEQTEGTSLGTQRERCRAYAVSRGWVVAAEFSDEGVSGVRADRPQLDRLLAACRRGDVDAVIVAKLDRFGRSNRHLAAAIGELDDLGVAFASVAESFDSSTPSGRFLRTLLGGAAEFERDMILERTAAGLRARASAGEWPGGPPPFGYRLGRAASGRNRLAVDEEEAETLRRAAALIIDEGCTTWTAAQTLNGLGLFPRKAPRWEHGHLRRTLRAPVLGGKWSYEPAGADPIDVEVPALLSPERHRALLDALDSTATGPRPGTKRPYLLSHGRLIGLCGGVHHGVSRHERGTRHYRCRNARPEADPRCDDHRVNADQVEDAAWREVVELLSDPGRLSQMAEDYLGLQDAGADAQADQLSTIDRRLASLREARTQRVVGALKAGIDPTVLGAAVSELEAEERALLAHRARLDSWRMHGVEQSDRLRGLKDLAGSARERLGLMTPRGRRTVLDLLDVRVVITGWNPCEECDGRGKTKGGTGGLICSVCYAMRRVPSLRIEGVILDALDLGRDDGPESRSPADRTDAVGIPFRLEASKEPLRRGSAAAS